ncbi:glutamate-rich protein 5 [Tiliqua scincoides]|uniref:glutamate-rich protein 5 n=1 Tax=Tiliqua scincoides TaxID=71010 RepID=UPI00346317EB
MPLFALRPADSPVALVPRRARACAVPGAASPLLQSGACSRLEAPRDGAVLMATQPARGSLPRRQPREGESVPRHALLSWGCWLARLRGGAGPRHLRALSVRLRSQERTAAAAMGCSSSAQTRVKECSRPTPKSPDAQGLQQGDDNHRCDLPITDEDKTISGQHNHGVMEEVDLGSDETKLNENLTKEEADTLVSEITKCTLSTCQRVDPEGTEPQSVAPEEKYGKIERLSLSLVEASESQPVEPIEGGESSPATEGGESWLSETIQDSKPEPHKPAEWSTTETAETAEDLNFVTEIVKELQMNGEDQLTEGEMGEKVETEMYPEIASEGFETKEEEMGEALLATEREATATEE